MIINHLLTGMILQVPSFPQPAKPLTQKTQKCLQRWVGSGHDFSIKNYMTELTRDDIDRF